MNAGDIAPPEGWFIDNNGGPFTELIGPILRKADTSGGVVKALRIEHRHTNANGVAHGGVLLALMDNLMGTAIVVAAPGTNYVTAATAASFLGAARLGDFVEAHAEITRQGRNLVFIRGTLTAGGRTLMTGEATFARIAAPPPR
jgi:uncharacterized protein (TIGR00369 family)